MSMRGTLLLLALVAAAAPANAGPPPVGETQGATIIGVQTLANGQALVTVDFATRAACANLLVDAEAAWVIDTTTDAGQALYANVLLAASARIRVIIRGSGTCVTVTGFGPGGTFTGTVEAMSSLLTVVL
jgi:hypothetical protein